MMSIEVLQKYREMLSTDLEINLPKKDPDRPFLESVSALFNAYIFPRRVVEARQQAVKTVKITGVCKDQDLAGQIFFFRTTLGLSRKEMSDLLNINPSHLFRLEKGQVRAGRKLLNSLANSLDFDQEQRAQLLSIGGFKS